MMAWRTFLGFDRKLLQGSMQLFVFGVLTLNPKPKP